MLRVLRAISIKRVMSNFTRLMLLVALTSCSAPRIAMESAQDSVSVVIHEKVIYKDTTIYVPVPAEIDKAVVECADTSRLETSVAESEAWIADGKLRHTLKNKPDIRLPKILSMPIYLKSEMSEHKVLRSITKEVEVEKKLNNWQIFRMMLGTLTLIIIGVWLLVKLLKRVL